ncbi:hypothetical protein I3843_04G086700 [Carya illinoinensis]|nr:hypothetical protein I3843_04G086700 [Carya illinoinensis]
MHLMCLNFFFLFFSPPGFILLKFKNNLRCPKHFAPPPSSPSCCPVSSEVLPRFARLRGQKV